MLGAMLAISPIGALVCSVGGFAVGYFVIRDGMTSDNLGQVLFIPWVWAVGLGPWAILWAVLANWSSSAHTLSEIRQYVAGRRSGHLRNPDDVMQMMQMDYDWLKKRDKER